MKPPESPPAWTGPENDYRGIASREPVAASVAVVIPVFNRAAALSRTLAGLEAQTHRDFEVVVVDDGSEEDIAATVELSNLGNRIQVLRRERDGFGAHRARNQGAAATSAAVLLFIDADCIPHPDLIDRHLYWHSRAGNVVVAGTRTHLDASDLGLGEIRDRSFIASADRATFVVPADWRGLFYRRNKQLTMGDAAFRAGVSSNLSVRRDRFNAVGGFSTVFTGWGGEDTELTWRLWNSGMFVVAENRALIYHQTQDDPLGAEGRSEARNRALALIADLVPHRFYRKVASPFHTVPKVSWLARTESALETNRLWRELSQATFADSEVVLLGPKSAVEHMESAAASSTRLTIVDVSQGLAGGLAETRGELVALIDGRSRIDRRLLARAVARLERDQRAGAARCAYRLPGNRQYRRLDDILRLDQDLGRNGFPFFGLARRRELLKDPELLARPSELWQAALERSRIEFLINDHAGIELEYEPEARLPGPGDLVAAGGREVAKAGKRVVDSLRRRPGPPLAGTDQTELAASPADEPVRINYVGFTGRDNLGDEAVLAGVRALLPNMTIGRDLPDPDVLMVGGGTLINGKGYYLTRVLRNDSPDLERVLFGTGVRSPAFWGTTEDMSEWHSFIESSLYAGVRGPDSARYLDELGFRGEVDILGDPALALTPPPGGERVSGRIVVCPVYTNGNLWGGDDQSVFSAMATAVERLRGRGHEIVFMSAFPADDRWLIEIMRRAGAADSAYVPGYADLGATMRWLESAELVIGERLHASILAAACTTPFVALEYRPKIRDFARSIGMEEQVVRTDSVHDLDDLIDQSLARATDITAELTQQVKTIRAHQRHVAKQLTAQLMASLR
ncbi:MAG: glycosyltransferase [Acidimicrobiia bacterium]|nr:glycosyltransferase [Acidimicrobiia bacterium]